MQYREEQRYIKEHKEELEKLLAMEQEHISQQVPGSLWEAFGAKKEAKEGEEKADGNEKSLPMKVEGGRSS